MPFAYYDRLPAAKKAVYRTSDGILRIPIPDPKALRNTVFGIKQWLSQADQRQVQSHSRLMVRGLLDQLDTAPVKLRVLAARPHDDYGELHGLYERPHTGRVWPGITVWMRTAKRQQVVAFRTYLRTVLHELCHHLDYDYLGLSDSLHTEGFYKRETSLFKQLIG